MPGAAVNPTALAERATLGTLLIDPAQIATVQRFLRPADFLETWHRSIYKAMLTRRIGGLVITPRDIHTDLVGTASAEDGVRAVRLIALMEVPPPRPRAAQYAIMVLEASLRRQIRDLGLLLRAGAIVATADTAGPYAATAGPFAEITNQLRDARARWSAPSVTTLDGRPVPDLAELDALEIHRLDVAMSAARLVDAASKSPHTDEILCAERDVLAAVSSRPEQLDDVRTRISPSLFTDQAHLATFAAICDLADHAEPIDAVTVCWQAQREQLLRGRGLDAATVHALAAQPPAGDAAHAAAVMAALATRTIADRSAAQFAALANQPGIEVGDLLDTTNAHVAAVLRAITGPNQPRSSWSGRRHLQLVNRTTAADAAKSASRTR
jgi:replicative DNA helicase